MMFSFVSIVTRSTMSCTGSPAARMPVASGKSRDLVSVSYRLEIPQPIIASVRVDPDGARMHVAAVGHERQGIGPPWDFVLRSGSEI